MRGDSVDQIVLSMQDAQRRKGQIPETVGQLQHMAESIRNAGFIHRDEFLAIVEGWEPSFNIEVSINRLDDREKQQIRAELDRQQAQAKADILQALDGLG